MKMNYKIRIAGIVSILIMGIGLSPTRGHAQPKAQIEQFYELQAAFHLAETVKDPVNGDSDDVVTQRIKDMLALWSSNGSLKLETGSPRDGTYSGQRDPNDSATCPMPSADPTNRGTLCTFFKYVSPAFQAANK